MKARTVAPLLALMGVLAVPWAAWAQSNRPVGLTDLRMEDKKSGRNLDIYVWYPTAAKTEPTLIADSPVFQGFRAVKNGDLQEGRFPLVILSHGLGGDRSQMGWLATRLAASGMIVAAPNHPGTTRGHMPTAETRRPWERARDLSRVATFLLGHAPFSARIQAARIAVIGHSLGGNSALALAGARFDSERFTRDCDAYSGDRDCQWYLTNAIGRDRSTSEQVQQSLRDERITAVVALDAGFARGFTQDSLAAITIPVLVIESMREVAGRPAGWYGRYLSTTMPSATTTYREMGDARHFSFVNECKPGATEILKAEGRGDEAMCVDGGGRGRAALHADIARMIEQFLRGAGFVPGQG